MRSNINRVEFAQHIQCFHKNVKILNVRFKFSHNDCFGGDSYYCRGNINALFYSISGFN